MHSSQIGTVLKTSKYRYWNNTWNEVQYVVECKLKIHIDDDDDVSIKSQESFFAKITSSNTEMNHHNVFYCRKMCCHVLKIRMRIFVYNLWQIVTNDLSMAKLHEYKLLKMDCQNCSAYGNADCWKPIAISLQSLFLKINCK